MIRRLWAFALAALVAYLGQLPGSAKALGLAIPESILL